MEDSPSNDNPEILELANLLEKIAENPYEYDNHVAYINLLGKGGDAEDLRQAREVFHSLYPFSEDLWLQWLDDEEHAASSQETVYGVYELYNRAVSDYLSINIWSRYLDFVEKNNQTIAEVLEVEPLRFLDMCFKKAIAATQYHIPESQTIWNRERERRLRLLNNDPKQLVNVTKMYLDRLQIPHAQMEETYSDFSAFVGKYSNDTYESTMSSTSREYGKALKALREREVFELQLNKSNYSFDAFSAYLDWEQSSGFKSQNPRMVQTLFERTLVIYWQQQSTWEDYVYYAIQKNFDVDEITSILERSTRNCPWSGDLWGLFIRFLAQQDDYPFGDIAVQKNKAISIPWLLAQKAEMAKLYYAWISICRLVVVDWDEETDEGGFLESELAECLEKMGTAFESSEQYSLGKLIIYIKTLSSKDDEARTIWNLMSKAHTSRCDYWLDRIGWERGQGQLRVCYDMFKKNLSKVIDDPGRFGSAYISFLAEEGTIRELNTGYTSVRKVLHKQGNVGILKSALTQLPQKVDSVIEQSSASDNKRKLSFDNEASPAKKPKVEVEGELQRDREHSSIIASNFPDDTSDYQIRHFFKDCGTVKSFEPVKSEGVGRSVILEFENEADAASALTRNLKTFKGQEILVEKYSQAVLWVTNYPATYDEQRLRDLFSEFGTVIDVRLPSLAFNANRRFAYIQFASPPEALSALAADGRHVDDGHTIVVKLSEPEKRKSRDTPAVDGRELYIVNIAFEASEGDVRALLDNYGKLQSLRLLSKPGESHHSGKGFAVFCSKEGAESAMALDGTKFLSRILKVQRSDPRRAMHSSRPRDLRTAKDARETSSHVQSPLAGAAANRTISGKSIGVVGLLDTVNEARVRSIIPDNLALEKVEMKPKNGGAILVFQKESDAGRAAIAIDGIQISGSTLRVMTIRDLKQHHPESAAPILGPVTSFVPTSVKFGAKKKRGGKW